MNFLDHGEVVFGSSAVGLIAISSCLLQQVVGLAQSQAPTLRVSKSPFYVFLLGVSQDAFETAK